MFGTLKDGILIPAPKAIDADIEIDGIVRRARVYNPKPEHYKSAGYLEVIEADYPEVAEDDIRYFEKVYTERDGAIYGEWVEVEAPEVVDPTPTLEERTTALEEEVSDLGEALHMIIEGVTE
jgi:hypothetical protein